MSNCYKLLLSAVLLLAFIPSICCAQSDKEILVADNTAFAFDLYKQLRESEGNIFFSPYSISAALAMTYAGARGFTEIEMARALNFSLNQKDLHPAFTELQAGLEKLQQSQELELSIANSLWLQTGHKLREEFLSLIKRYHQGLIAVVDFNDAVAAAGKINSWIEENTKAKIKKLVSPDLFNTLTRLVIVNAIYFKGAWKNQFDADFTEDAPFYLLDGNSIKAPFMYQKGRFRYAEQGSVQVLEMNYLGDMLSMLVVLPKEKNGITELESDLSAKQLRSWKKKLAAEEVMVYLPKFKVTSIFNLKSAMKSLGMAAAFDNADFSGIDGTRKLFIQEIVHKAFVDVNEAGTEAAAATGAIFGARSLIIKPKPVFRADHPFVFIIQDNFSGSILFLGRVNDPTKSED